MECAIQDVCLCLCVVTVKKIVARGKTSIIAATFRSVCHFQLEIIFHRERQSSDEQLTVMWI